MADVAGFSVGEGVAFIVSYEVVCSIIAKACSSPQTAELNIGARADTLMKWVWIGVAESVAVILIAAYIDSKVPGANHTSAIIGGGFLGILITVAEYLYAKRSGIRSGGPATETY
jgi:hypothetical protein